MSIYKDIYDRIRPLIEKENFKIPNNQPCNTYFLEFLEQILNEYQGFYETNLAKYIDSEVPFNDEEGKRNENVTLNKIKYISETIIKTVQLYYDGKIQKASEYFTKRLNDELVNDLIFSTTIKENENFYRARKDDCQLYHPSDLFHIKFELREIVSTARYSIPGLPALYLGNNTYTCWQEFEKSKFRDLWFAKMTNQREMEVTSILRIEDFLKELQSINSVLQLTFLLRYLVTFPLILATTIKVKNGRATFKPEYIIPQMLIEYITSKSTIDGIKFPSTKVNYSSLHNMQAYNYVFPVKKIEKSGYCEQLVEDFLVTKPTCLDMEDIIHNPPIIGTTHGYGTTIDKREIEIIKEVKVPYNKTSFGKLENRLKNRETYRVE
ncbi:hypothetical protein SAMN04488033_105128 [Salegentibacter agarivorans]|uniref:RES domain-containing protein n=1 Tax=Salegentibacter agarivorans TaxID=345907 RepID=A0A1I2L0B6_9FLAO|nr:hypothetical protein [Salegentibacter agarivorans]SFF70596.1 hypothetical protein SAMN04488033_105128 [Salegentibacter agarivorans]